MKRLTSWVLRTVHGCLVALCLLSPGYAATSVADVVYFGGIIYTLTENFGKPLDPYRPRSVEMVAVKDGKIVFAGEMAQAARAGYLDPERVGCFANLHGKIMMPGFVATGEQGQQDPAFLAAAGITTLELYGVDLPAVLPDWQQTKSERAAWPLRVILHPQGGGKQGAQNRAFLGWPCEQQADQSAAQSAGDTPQSQDARASAAFPQPARQDGSTPTLLAAGADISNFRRAETLFPLDSHQLFLGAWRLVLDTPASVPTSLWLTSNKHAVAPAGFLELAILYHIHGQTLAIQAAGDMAMEIAVRALEKAVLSSPLEDARHSIYPASMTERQHVARLAGHYESMHERLSGGNGPSRSDQRAIITQNWTDEQWSELARKMRSQRTVLSYDMAAVLEWGSQPQTGKVTGWAKLGAGEGANLTPTGWNVAYELPFGLQSFAADLETKENPAENNILSDVWTPLVQMQAAVLRVPRTVTAPEAEAFAEADVDPLSQKQTARDDVAVNGAGFDLSATFQAKSPDGSREEFYQYDQRVNILQALHGVTTVPVFRNHLDHLLGTIEVGKLADFVVLDKNPLEVAFTDPLALDDILVQATIVGGNVVFGSLDCSKRPPYEVSTGDDSLAVGIRAR